MRGVRGSCLGILVLLAMAFPVKGAAGSGLIERQKAAGPYLLVLKVEAAESMVMGHPKAGELMLHGQMANCRYRGGRTMGGMTFCNRHVELHVYRRSTRKAVTTAVVSIVMVNEKNHASITVPIMAMMNASLGMRDYHYGNNVYVPGGTYRIHVLVNKTVAQFTVRLT